MPIRTTLWTTLAAALATAAPAAAANLALLVETGPEGEAAEDLGLLGETLNAQGYEVIQRTGADRAAIQEGLEAFADRIGEAERALVVFAGPLWEGENEVWLLPSGYDGDGWIDAAFAGVPLSVLLEVAGERPGRSAVVVAHEERADAGEAPEPIGLPEVPQGVLVLAGPRAAAIDAVTDRLLTEGLSAASALEEVEGLTVAGFASPDASFGDRADAPVTLPEPPVTLPEPPPTPGQRAEADEAALELDRTARRTIQENLTILGYATRGIDGIFGPGTRTAIAEWQEAEGYDPTGFLTAEQVGALREEATIRSAELAEEAERARAAEEAADAAFWRNTGAGGTAADFRAYLSRYPDGIYADEARAGLARLEAEARAEAEAVDRAAWDAALAEGDAEALRRYLAERPGGAFAGEAEARLRAMEDAPREAAARAEAAAAEDAMGLSEASRALIESQLEAVGYDIGEPDGVFDQATRDGLRAFQARQGLEPTGYVDQATVQALIVASLGLR